MKAKSISFLAVVGLFTLSALGFSQEQGNEGADLSRFLNDKEQRYLSEKGSVEDLSDEEVEHVQRIQRLQQLRAQEDAEGIVIAEAAGAERPDEAQPIVEPEPRREITPAEAATELQRENAVLRSEVRRLRAQLRAIDRQSQELLYRDLDYLEPQPRFYVPVR